MRERVFWRSGGEEVVSFGEEEMERRGGLLERRDEWVEDVGEEDRGESSEWCV